MSSDPTTTPTESGRDRVRRLLIDPLAEAGFRHPIRTPEDKARAHLDRIADALGYMSDANLARLRAVLQTKGAGAARDFWPSLACVLGWAEVVQPRPLEEVPELARWFRSRAGTAALEGGRLVAEFQWWQAKKAPPRNERERFLVRERAQGHAERAELARDRLRRGVPLRPEEAQWLDWFEATEARIAELVAEGAAERASAA